MHTTTRETIACILATVVSTSFTAASVQLEIALHCPSPRPSFRSSSRAASAAARRWHASKARTCVEKTCGFECLGRRLVWDFGLRGVRVSGIIKPSECLGFWVGRAEEKS